MSEVWTLYVQKFNKEPESANQLMSFSQKEGKPLSFKDARQIFDNCKGKSNKSTTTTTTSSTSSSSSSSTSSTSSTNTTQSKVQKKEKEGTAEEEEEEKEKRTDGDEDRGEDGGEDGDGNNKSALFRDLNKGAKVVTGLKKVTKEMKNSKTSSSTESKNKVAKTKPPPETTTATAKTTAAKPSSMRKQGPRFMCEYFTEGVQQLTQPGIMDEVFIFQCKNSGYIIPGKAKNIIIDSCDKIQVEINDVVSTVEMVNSKAVTLFIKGTAPSIIVDKCSEPRLMIFKAALEKEPHIITSMVTGMNVEVPGDTEEDWKEIPIPQQFETIIDPFTKKAVTKPVQHA